MSRSAALLDFSTPPSKSLQRQEANARETGVPGGAIDPSCVALLRRFGASDRAQDIHQGRGREQDRTCPPSAVNLERVARSRRAPRRNPRAAPRPRGRAKRGACRRRRAGRSSAATRPTRTSASPRAATSAPVLITARLLWHAITVAVIALEQSGRPPGLGERTRASSPSTRCRRRPCGSPPRRGHATLRLAQI